MKRYRAKRETAIISLFNSETISVHQGFIVLFNPDDFEEVEEECMRAGFCEKCNSVHSCPKIEEKNENGIEPLQPRDYGMLGYTEDKLNEVIKILNSTFQNVADHEQQIGELQKQVKEIKEKI